MFAVSDVCPPLANVYPLQSDTCPIQPILASNNLFFFARYLTFNIKNYIFQKYLLPLQALRSI